jgi:predicted metal-dependent phosphoesterase TrpH
VSVDLHTHTTHSDGTLGPAELVDLARKKSLTAIAITDHDITSGNDEAISRGKELEIKVIPGIELSVTFDLPGNGHLHILGLFIDPHHTHLNQTLQNIRLERSKRNQKILNRLKELGKPISSDDLSFEGGIGSVGRPHIATVMVKMGYVKNNREAFNRFLKKGSPAYFDRVRLTANQAIDLIHLAGGIAIIAHPTSLGFSSLKDTGEYFLHLKKMGLDGFEAYSSGQDDYTRQQLLSFARDNNMVVSGGSDFHGSLIPAIDLGSGRGDLNIPDQVYWDLLNYWKEKNMK